MAAKATVQCPDLASASMDAVILTKENVASLKVDSSRTEPGTVVNISCLAAPQFRLVGATTLTCLANGQWDKTIPVCVPAAGSQSTNMNTVSATNNTTGSDISMLPMIVIAGIVGVIFLSLAVVMVVVLVQRGRQRNSHSKRRLDDLPADRWHMRSDPVPLDIGDIVDNVSSRCPPGPHVHGS
ncbi:hypothetical protein C0Q70_03490 [Pomacea canaliculata]|uniref:Sushi domain-containing protein n=2 Tax=Pomacea canaliculata TaxID=400727 RepID=A0A2T7PSV7_POMCA|nr:hypothetical protein C0Q70_03490 [Pomacea canaliculata]